MLAAKCLELPLIHRNVHFQKLRIRTQLIAGKLIPLVHSLGMGTADMLDLIDGVFVSGLALLFPFLAAFGGVYTGDGFGAFLRFKFSFEGVKLG